MSANKRVMQTLYDAAKVHTKYKLPRRIDNPTENLWGGDFQICSFSDAQCYVNQTFSVHSQAGLQESSRC